VRRRGEYSRNHLALQQPGIQDCLNDYTGGDTLVPVDVPPPNSADAAESSVIEIETSLILGDQQIAKWLKN
jgi:hypothetical protein